MLSVSFFSSCLPKGLYLLEKTWTEGRICLHVHMYKYIRTDSVCVCVCPHCQTKSQCPHIVLKEHRSCVCVCLSEVNYCLNFMNEPTVFIYFVFLCLAESIGKFWSGKNNETWLKLKSANKSRTLRPHIYTFQNVNLYNVKHTLWFLGCILFFSLNNCGAETFSCLCSHQNFI